MQLPLLDEETMYEAFVNRDREFSGLFFTGVTTTGIFCLPTCTARKPKREHVVFFQSASEAMKAGFRPCRVCRPLEPPEGTPPAIASLVARVLERPDEPVRDTDLPTLGLDPGTVRRWFRKHHGLTFQGYQRLLRLNSALRLLAREESVTDTAFETGYGSLSGFGAAVKKATRRSPREHRGSIPVSVLRLDSPLGPMIAAATERGLCLLEFTDRRMLETEFRTLESRPGFVLLPGVNAPLRTLEAELAAYFAGTLKSFTVTLDPVGSEFRRSVWEVLRRIPYGETWSYRDQARALGDERLTRAVGGANGQNIIAIVIPCHRVIGEDGNLVGYGGGLWRKHWLLEHERRHRGGTAQ